MKEKIKLIAEIGINHNGDLEIAKKLIKNSAECGFDFVKFQRERYRFSLREILSKRT